MSAFTDGFLIGFAMIIFMGPVFFTILQISLSKGFWPGFMAAFGVFISDVACVLICYYLSQEYLDNLNGQGWIAILGGLILGLIGLKYIIKPSVDIKVIHRASSLSLINAFGKGFLVNFVNPFVFGVWIGVIGLMKTNYSDPVDHFWYLAAANIAILCTDTGKVILSRKLGALLNEKVLKKAYLLIGIVMIGFSIRLFMFAFIK